MPFMHLCFNLYRAYHSRKHCEKAAIGLIFVLSFIKKYCGYIKRSAKNYHIYGFSKQTNKEGLKVQLFVLLLGLLI